MAETDTGSQTCGHYRDARLRHFSINRAMIKKTPQMNIGGQIVDQRQIGLSVHHIGFSYSGGKRLDQIVK